MALAADERATGTSSRVKFAIAVQVAATIAVAGACAFLATWLAARAGLVARVDFTADRRNTVDPALAEVVTKLPGSVKIETFMRPLDAPLERVSSEAQQLIKEFLFVLASSSHGKVEVLHYDLNDVAQAKPRMAELDLREENAIVVSSAAKRVVLHVFRDIAQIDPGVPDPRRFTPPSLAKVRIDEAIAYALKNVSVGDVTKIYFSTGHGEREIYEHGEHNLATLCSALARDGFRFGWWDVSREAEVPKDCAVLAVIDPEQPFVDAEYDAIQRYLARGGRLIACPSKRNSVLSVPHGVGALLAEHGIDTLSGWVAAPTRDSSGAEVVGNSACAALIVASDGLDSKSPVTESLWRARRGLFVVLSRAFVRGARLPKSGLFQELVRAPREAWVDRPDVNGFQDWRPDREHEESGPVALCVALSYRPDGLDDAADEQRSTRILALGSADVFSDGQFDRNADFALNAFNWLAARDWRLSISPRTDSPRTVDVARGDALKVVNRVALIGLPLACALLGLFLFFQRRS